MSINIEGREPKEKPILDMFGFPIEVGDTVVVAMSGYASLQSKHQVKKITEKSIFIGPDRKFSRDRRVGKNEAQKEIINKTKLEKYLEEHETNSDERLTSFRKNNVGS